MKKLLLIISLFLYVLPTSAQSAFFTSTTTHSSARETWVFALAGQSNMNPNTNDTGEGLEETYPEGTLQWGRWGNEGSDNNTLVPASVPLQHISTVDHPNWGPGLMTRFANKMREAYPRVDIVFIPNAKGGSGFGGGDWNKGDLLYEDLVARTNLCLAENPSFKFKGIMMHQGEADGVSNDYTLAITNFVANLRDDITGADGQTPFVCGGQVADKIAVDSNAIYINNVHNSVPSIIPYSGFANSLLPTALNSYGDTLHFTASNSLILGDRFFDAYLFAKTNTLN